MAVKSETKLLAIEFNDDGSMGVKLEKRLVENGILTFREPHRFVMHPEANNDKTIANIHRHLDNMTVQHALVSFPPLSPERIQRIKDAFAAFRKSPPRPQGNPNIRAKN